MTHFRRHLIAALACSVSTLVCGQEQPLPKEITGRYLAVGTSAGQIFSLTDMAQGPDATFVGKLTWWTSQTACTLRSAPISGRITPTGIAFDTKTKCDLGFSVELTRQDKGWVGKGSTTTGLILALESKAE